MTDKIKGLLSYIYGAENGGRINYDVVYGGIPAHARPSKPLTEMTVGEVYQWQMDNRGKWGSTAAGALQVMPETLAGLVRKGAVSSTDTFDAATQDRMTVALMRGRGLDDWQAGKLSTEDFGTNLAKEWASLPVLKDTYRKGQFIPAGNAYYGGVGANKSRALVSAMSFRQQLGDPGRAFIAEGDYGPTGTQGTMLDHAGTRLAGNMDQRMAVQFEGPGEQPYRHMQPWEAPDVDLGPDLPATPTSGPDDGSRGPSGPQLTAVDYRTRTGQGGSPVLQDWGQAFRDVASDGYIVRELQRRDLAGRYAFDRSFDPLGQAEQDGLLQHHGLLGRARNREHYNSIRQQIEWDDLRQRRMSAWDGTAAHTLGGLLNPDTIVTMAVPIGGVAGAGLRGAGGNFLRTGATTAFYTGASEYAIEAGRASLDPNSSQIDSFARVAGATVLSGLIGGGIGVMAGARARKGLAFDLAQDIARSKGVGQMTREVDLGNGARGRIVIDPQGRSLLAEVSDAGPGPRWYSERGVKIVGEEIHVNEEALQWRFQSGAHGTPAESAQELMEFEVARAAALSRVIKNFWSDELGAVGKGAGAGRNPFATVGDDGVVKIDAARIQKAIDEGEPIILGPATGSRQARKIEPVVVRPGVFQSADEAAEAIQKAHDLANKARDTGEFRSSIQSLMRDRAESLDDIEPELTVEQRLRAERKAEAEAAEALEQYRRDNNKVLQNAKLEALARLTDGPFKRVHRNALSPEARDLVDTLAADGAFLRGSDKTGLTVGPSVYSRAKTWAGVTRRVWDRENELYNKYLGIEQEGRFADLGRPDFVKRAQQKPDAINRDVFRQRVTQAYINGEKDPVNEVMEMVEVLRGAFDEYQGVAKEYGVIESMDAIRTRMTRLQSELNDFAAYGPEPDSRVARLQEQLEELRQRAKIAEQEPREDYFTRIWNKSSISKHRDLFKERVVKPWMRQQNRVQMWVVGKDELTDQMNKLIKQLGDNEHPRVVDLRHRINDPKTPEKSGFNWIDLATDPASINKRADEMIEQILGEAEPDDLTTLREANRPTFGRHRQFDIPNAMLLKGGGKGNGIADFIETDYMLVQNIYSERMGPAIEMARSFARPVDGISAVEGFEEALLNAQVAERRAYKGKDFKSHWAKIERDMRHLKDRVTNRVIRDPNRWDNRVATNLRNWSHLAFMGMSALPAVQEVGTLIMRHGMGRVFQPAMGELDEGLKLAKTMGIEEMRKAGAIMEVVNGVALSRFAETGMEATMGTAPERWLKTAANKYFLWNGLAPLSTRMKEIDAGLRVSDTVERIMRVSDLGKGADEADLADLARWGLSRADAERIAKEPVEMLEGGHWVANTDMWGDEELVRKFRAAIAQGNENTILMATAADKPTIIDGTMYLRKGGVVDKYAARAGLREVGDYWQVQSGLMTLPFTFWNYAIAAHNKILVAGLDEPSAQKLGGVAAMVGLGMMVAQLRTPEFKWEQKNTGEKLLAGIDQSGVMGILSQLSGIAEQPTPMDMALRAAGAGPNVAFNAIEGVTQGDANSASWALPFRNHFLLKGLFDRAVDGIERAEG